MTRPDEIIIYNTDDGRAHVALQVLGNDVWLTTTQMGELFDVGAPAVNHHVRDIFRSHELEPATCKRSLQQPGQARSVNHYNLEMILAVGYRVRGPRGAQFRRWATTILTEYLTKGFALDDPRLKNDGADTHFDELLERVRDIRTSEKQFFRKICDVIKESSEDYDGTLKETQNFFASIQNKLHFAVHGHTAAEIIHLRADHSKRNMGLTNWDGQGKPLKKHIAVAKNYLTDSELDEMRRLTNMFLDYAEDRAKKRKGMLLRDWIALTDKWLVFNEREVLSTAGTRRMEQAKAHAAAEWDLYQRRLDAEVNRRDLASLEAEVAELHANTGKRH